MIRKTRRLAIMILLFLVFFVQIWLGRLLHQGVVTAAMNDLPTSWNSYSSIQSSTIIHPKAVSSFREILPKETGKRENYYDNNKNIIDTSSSSTPEKLLIFRHVFTGQGTGNVMSGLLAAHWLGMEFNRTVCVAQDYTTFHGAFQSTTTITEHSNTYSCQVAQQQHPPTSNNTLKHNNYDESRRTSECVLKQRLSSSKEKDLVLYYTGNTYPRWSKPMVRDFFHQHYHPTKALSDFLSWNINDTSESPPEVVVHLRQPDGIVDERPGLDNQTLHTLGQQLLSNHTFLVTNNVIWYGYFQDRFGWSHPSWSAVGHSAFRNMEWVGERLQNTALGQPQPERPTTTDQQQLSMQMWADWYTLLCAKQIYHTASDFSVSTARWNPKPSWTIQGSSSWKNGSSTLLLKEDFEEVFPPRLIDRMDDELKYCKDESKSSRNTEPLSKEEYKSQLQLTLALARRRQQIHPIGSSFAINS